MRVESSAQIEDIAGYTSVTGQLEISGSDLECLDFLACPYPEQECVPVYDPAECPWGYEDVGLCMVPA